MTPDADLTALPQLWLTMSSDKVITKPTVFQAYYRSGKTSEKNSHKIYILRL